MNTEAVAEKIGTYSTYSDHRHWFFFTLLYILVDYGRPQDILPIGFIRPGMIVTLILLLFIISSSKKKDADSKQTRMIWLFIILLGAYIPFATNNYLAYDATISMLLYMPFIISIINCIKSIEQLKKLIFVLILLMIYISGYSLLHGGLGSGSFFQDENDLSLYINMYLPFCFFLFSVEKKRLRKVIYFIGIIIGILAVIISFSRGGFLGLAASAFVMWLFSPNKTKSLFLLCILSLFFYLYTSNMHPDPSKKGGKAYWEEMSTVRETGQGTAAGRLEAWKSGWRMFLDNPFGIGGKNFIILFPEYQTDYFKRDMWGRAAHSLWFTLIPELGIFGTIIYLLLIYYNIKDCFFIKNSNQKNDPDSRYLHSIAIAFIASFTSFFVSGTFLSVLYYPHFWYLTGFLVATKNISKRQLQLLHNKKRF